MKRTRVTERFCSVVIAPQGRKSVLAGAVNGVLLASAALGSAPAIAQQTTVEGEVQRRPLEEIIVTARYREERLQEIPIAITAIDADEIEMRAFTVASDVAYTVPNASFRPAQAAFGNTMTAFVRGIGQYDFDFAFEPGVAIYIDDMYHPFTLGSQIQLMDLDHVEVLRGPQGTLFGRGSIGGAIRYVSKKPQGDDTGSIGLTIGDYDRLDIRASYDFGISENLSARVTGVATSREGYQDVVDFTCAFPGLSGDLPSQPINRANGCKVGTQGGQDFVGGRGMLRWEGSEDFEVTFAADYQKENAEPKADTVVAIDPGAGFVFSGGLPPNPFPNPLYDERFLPSDPYTTYATYNDYRSGLTFKPETEYESWTVSGRADWGLTDSVDMALILAYADISSTLVSDADGSPINIQTTAGVQTIDYYTAELRFSGRAWDRMDWTLGGFYYDGESINDQIVSIPFLSNILDGVSFDELGPPFVNAHNVHENTNESVFAHAVFDITDKLALTAGVRYSSDEKDVDFDNTRVQNPNVVVKGNNTDWKVGLDYQFTPDFLAYAGVSTGYRPGSYNPRPFQATQVVAVDAEESTAYELGFKSDLFDRRLRLNMAVFYTDWETRILPVGGTECPLIDLGPPPVYATVPPGTPGSITDDLGNICLGPGISRTFYENSPGEVQGAELEATWEPIDGLVFSGVYGFIDWESPDINDDPTVTSERPPYVPEDNWALSVSYAMAMGSGASLTPRLDLYGQTEICSQTVFTDSLFPAASCTDGYELLNARLEWRSPNDTWTVAVGATNVTDEEYFYNKFDLTAFGQPHAEGQPGRPREWYVTLGRNF
jgi:iron complex outermembrane receptor protein